MKSLKELFRIGRGPSSSHTMAPARAAEIFKVRYSNAASYEAALYGSLAATGKGHFTDVAIIQALAPQPVKIIWKPEIIMDYHPNALKLTAFDSGKCELGSSVFYSTGGGALVEENAPDTTPDYYPFKSMQEIMDYCRQEGIPLWEVVKRFDDSDIMEYLEEVLDCMDQIFRYELRINNS